MTPKSMFPVGVPNVVEMVIVEAGTVLESGGNQSIKVEVDDTNIAFLEDKMYCTRTTFERYTSQERGLLQ